jgi:hypothetical protein
MEALLHELKVAAGVGVSSPPGSTQQLNTNEKDKTSSGDNVNIDEGWQTVPCGDAAPPGGLDSRLINVLLQNWTTDTRKLMQLRDWFRDLLTAATTANTPEALDLAARGIAPIVLQNLAPQVRDGFVRVVLPLLRERHKVLVLAFVRASKSGFDLKLVPSGSAP